MLVDQDASIPLIPLSPGGCSVPIEPPSRRERGPRGKKRLKKNPNGHGHNQRDEHKGRAETQRTSCIMTSTFYPNKIAPPFYPLCPAPLLLEPLRVLLYIILCVTRSAS